MWPRWGPGKPMSRLCTGLSGSAKSGQGGVAQEWPVRGKCSPRWDPRGTFGYRRKNEGSNSFLSIHSPSIFLSSLTEHT